MIITTHACERYLERELGFITWNIDDIYRARKYLNSFIRSHKHQNLCKKKSEIMHVLVDKLILVFTKAKEVLITLYPMDEDRVNYLNNKKHQPTVTKINNTPITKFKRLAVNGNYPDPRLLSVSITETKKKIYISINDPKNPYNLSGCYESIDQAQTYIDDYAEFYLLGYHIMP